MQLVLDPMVKIIATAEHPRRSELDKMLPQVSHSTLIHPLESSHRIFLERKSDQNSSLFNILQWLFITCRTMSALLSKVYKVIRQLACPLSLWGYLKFSKCSVLPNNCDLENSKTLLSWKHGFLPL